MSSRGEKRKNEANENPRDGPTNNVTGKFRWTKNWFLPQARENEYLSQVISNSHNNDSSENSFENEIEKKNSVNNKNNESDPFFSAKMLLPEDKNDSMNSEFFDVPCDTNGHTAMKLYNRNRLPHDDSSRKITDNLRKHLRASASAPSDTNTNPTFRDRHKSSMSMHVQPEKITWLKFRYDVGMLINHPSVQMAIISLIIVNALTAGLNTVLPQAKDVFAMIDLVFLCIYTIEIIMQFIYFGWRLILDGWLLFDLAVVCMSWVSTIPELMGSDSGSAGGFQVIRAFRVFKMVRLLVRIKVLRDLIAAIFQVLPRMGAIMILLSLMFYIFAVLFTQLLSEMVIEDYYDDGLPLKPFGNLHLSLLTCLEMMTGEWAEYGRQATFTDEPYASKYNWIWFIIFILLCAFIVSNLMIAVICDAVALVENMAREHDLEETDVLNPDEVLKRCQIGIIDLDARVQLLQQSQQHLQDLAEVLATEMSSYCDITISAVPPSNKKKRTKKKER